MQKDSKIYIAGHRGLVGSAIMRNLASRGYNNIITRELDEMDLRRQAEAEAFFESERPEFVFIAAAKVGGIVANNTYRAEFIYDNMSIAMNVINSAYKFGAKKLLNLGSSCIYPKLAPQPLKEEYLLTGELEPTNEPYAIAKIAAIKLCSAYNFQYGTDFISVMPTNLYGANDNFNLETSHVLPALIRKMILAKALSENDFEFIKKDIKKYPIGFGLDKKINPEDNNSIIDALSSIGITAAQVQIWGSGNVYREFLHVDDMAGACIFLMENFPAKAVGEFVNIGTGSDLTIKEIAYLIKEAAGFGGGLVFDVTKPEGTPRKLLDVSRLNSLGWKAKISLQEGIEGIIQEFKG